MLNLTMTCAPYDRARALIDKSVVPQGIALDITPTRNLPGSRLRAQDGTPYDVAEFYTGLYMADLPFRTLGYTAIPIFVKRMFRHSYIYINSKAGIRKPSDLNGKRVGVQTWFTSAAIWARGVLEDEWGLDVKSIRWVADLKDGIGDWKPPSGLDLEILPAGVKQQDLLASGEIQCSITTGVWAPNVHPNIDFLFPDYADRERDYFRRTGFFPIMHTLLIRNAVLERDPWVAMSLFDAWMRSKEALYRDLERDRVHKTALWYRGLYEEEQAAAGRDFYRWGFKQTRAEVDQMLTYVHRYGLVPHKAEPEEMFHPSTLGT
jgi:4,5-dihydroxyphthalate decarboxylase